MLRIAIIAGSTRPGRRSVHVASWIQDFARRRGDATYTVIDLAEVGLPMLDEPLPAAAGRYSQPHTRSWAATVASYDAFVFVTPEYNRGMPAVLKNALDFVYAEWHDKAAGFVGYGVGGGVRAVEQLRSVATELHLAGVRDQVALMLGRDFDDEGRPRPDPDNERAVTAMLDGVVSWATALRTVRTLPLVDDRPAEQLSA